MRPAISIVICTRNRAESLGKALSALERVHSQLPWEAIIVDNASTDDTRDVIRKFEGKWLKYVYAEKIGLGFARELGHRHASGEIISFTDDDCYIDPGYVDAIAQVFREHPEVGAVGGKILLFDPTDAHLAIDDRTEPVMVEPRQFIKAGAFHGANLSFRRKVLEEIGGISPKLGAGTPFPAEDIVACASVLWAGYPMRYDPRPLVYHHHGRKPSDVPKQMASYDNGRGAYYAEFIRRRQTRKVYVKNWWWLVKWTVLPEGLAKLPDGVEALKREVRSGSSYLWQERAWVAWVAFTLLGNAMIAYVAAKTNGLAILPDDQDTVRAISARDGRSSA